MYCPGVLLRKYSCCDDTPEYNWMWQTYKPTCEQVRYTFKNDVIKYTNYQEGWDPIIWFNPTTFVCLSQARSSNIMVYSMFNDLRWEMIVCFVDICVIDDHCLSFLFFYIVHGPNGKLKRRVPIFRRFIGRRDYCSEVCWLIICPIVGILTRTWGQKQQQDIYPISLTE